MAIHGFDGQCSPKNDYPWRHDTFSLGVFEMLKRKSGAGYKRGRVLVRIKGWTSDPDPVYEEARRIKDLLDTGKYSGPKTVNLARK